MKVRSNMYNAKSLNVIPDLIRNLSECKELYLTGFPIGVGNDKNKYSVWNEKSGNKTKSARFLVKPGMTLIVYLFCLISCHSAQCSNLISYGSRFVTSLAQGFHHEIKTNYLQADYSAGTIGARIGTGVGSSLGRMPGRAMDAFVDTTVRLATESIPWHSAVRALAFYTLYPALYGITKMGYGATQLIGLRKQEKTEEKSLATPTLNDDEFVKSLPIAAHERTLLAERFQKQASMKSGELAALQLIRSLPWNKYTSDNLDIAHAKKILDEKHYGMQQVKDAILDYIAIVNHNKNACPPALCLVGPPGVGKTSIAESIAACLGRSHERIACGTISDKAELTGFSSTYVGAQAGAFIKAVQRSNSMNPVVTVDELDKLATHGSNNPMSVFLEVLNPEQSRTFRDPFIGIPCNLSRALFIATANSLDTIPRPLRDRMKIIEIPGYTAQEKLAIIKNHLLPKVLANTGLTSHNVLFNDEHFKHIIEKYSSQEAGVRELDRTLTTICSKIVRHLVEKKEVPPINIPQIDCYMNGNERKH